MRLAMLSLVLVAGCSLDRTGLGSDGGSTFDTGVLDAGPIDAGIDSGPWMDGGPIDAGPGDDGGPGDAGIDAPMTPDAGIDAGIDAGTDAGIDSGIDGGIDSGIDSGIDAGPPPLRGCGAIYGGLSGYELCTERMTECEMYVTLGGSSCTDVCAGAGGSCIAAYPEGFTHCSRGIGSDTCSSTHNDEICVCARIP